MEWVEVLDALDAPEELCGVRGGAGRPLRLHRIGRTAGGERAR